jgi:hypothetical protein
MDNDITAELHREGAACMAPVSNSSSIQDSHEEAILAEIEQLPMSNADPTATPTYAVVSPAPLSFVATRMQKRVYSIAHDDLLSDRIIIFHIDLEHSGEEAGIVQLSVVAYNPSSQQFCGEFDEYVQPPKNAKWEKGAMEVYGIRPDQDRIKNADGIVDVWPRFINFVESRLDNGAKRGIIAAWGGESCDIEWLFRIAYVQYHDKLFLPKWCPYFMDPCYVIKHYKSCRLNEKHRPPSRQGNACDIVWCFLNDKTELEGVHSSLVDARAQAVIVADKRLHERCG